jgi:hypothetical protein
MLSKCYLKGYRHVIKMVCDRLYTCCQSHLVKNNVLHSFIICLSFSWESNKIFFLSAICNKGESIIFAAEASAAACEQIREA